MTPRNTHPALGPREPPYLRRWTSFTDGSHGIQIVKTTDSGKTWAVRWHTSAWPRSRSTADTHDWHMFCTATLWVGRGGARPHMLMLQTVKNNTGLHLLTMGVAAR